MKLVSAVFVVNAGPLAGYASLAVGGGHVDSIVPARLLPNGEWTAVDKERAEGLGIARKAGPASSQRVERYFVPWSNVAALSYEPETAK